VPYLLYTMHSMSAGLLQYFLEVGIYGYFLKIKKRKPIYYLFTPLIAEIIYRRMIDD
jgi:hypothetical protein